MVIRTVTSPKRTINVVDNPTTSPSHRRTRTIQQEDGISHKRDQNEAVGIFDLELIKKWTCDYGPCINRNRTCFITPLNDDHYSLDKAKVKTWATAIYH